MKAIEHERATASASGHSTARNSRSSTPHSAYTNPTPSPSLRSISLPPDENTLNILKGRNDLDSEHVGMLIREKEQYILFRIEAERAAGRIVSKEVEQMLQAWLEEQRSVGSIPPSFTPDYLSSLRIEGDPLKIDLKAYIARNKPRWSPVESLLRAGISPVQLPPHLIPHSIAATRTLLYHWPNPSALQEPQLRDQTEAQGRDETGDYDWDMAVLFDENEDFDEILLSEGDSKKRLQHYMTTGIWDTLEDGSVAAAKLPFGVGDLGVGGLVEGIATGYDGDGYALEMFERNMEDDADENGEGSEEDLEMAQDGTSQDKRDAGEGEIGSPSTAQPVGPGLPPSVQASRIVDTSSASSGSTSPTASRHEKAGDGTSIPAADIDKEGEMIRDRALLTLCSTLIGKNAKAKAIAKAKAAAANANAQITLTPAEKAAASRARTKAAKDRSLVPDLLGDDEMLGIEDDDDAEDGDLEDQGRGTKRRAVATKSATPGSGAAAIGKAGQGQKRKRAPAAAAATAIAVAVDGAGAGVRVAQCGVTPSAQTTPAASAAIAPSKKRARKTEIKDPAPPYQPPTTPLPPKIVTTTTTTMATPLTAAVAAATTPAFAPIDPLGPPPTYEAGLPHPK